MKIYVAMICKNEANDIGKCLRAILPEVDYVYIGDTGSTDNTLEVIKQTTLELQAEDKVKVADINKPVCGVKDGVMWDFSKAKNTIISCIYKIANPEDYVFVLDADDIYEKDTTTLREKLLSRNCSQTTVKINNFHSFRIWKVGANVKYSGPVHEVCTILPDSIRSEDIRITHEYQTQADVNNNQEPAIERNLRILKKVYDSGDRSPRTLFYLAQSYRLLGRFDKAREFYGKYIDKPTSFHDERMVAYCELVDTMKESGVDATTISRVCFEGISEDSRWSTLWTTLAQIFLAKGHYRTALHFSNLAIQPLPDTVMWFTEKDYFENPIKVKTQSLEKMGNLNAAIDTWKEYLKAKGLERDSKLDQLEFDRDKKIYVVNRPGAIGDVICAIRACLLKVGSDSMAEIILHTAHPTVYKLFTNHPRLHVIDMQYQKANAEWAVNNGHYAIDLIGYPLKDGYPKVPMKKHLIEYFCEELGVNYKDEKLANRNENYYQNYVILAPRAGWSIYKQWEPSKWQELYESITSKFPNLKVYELCENYDDSVTKAIPVSGTLEEVGSDILETGLLIGVDSFPQHLRGVYGLPSIVLFGSTSSVGSGYKTSTNIEIDNPCRPCYREDPTKTVSPIDPPLCPFIEEYSTNQPCMKTISVASVMEKVEEYVKTLR